MSRSTQHPHQRSSQDALAHVTAEIARFLASGVMPWRAPWDRDRALAATPGLPLRLTGQPYRGANVALLWAAQMARGYAKRTWLTYRQALLAGGQVRQGEKACPIIFYGQAGSDSEAQAPTDAPAKSYRFLKLFHVFNCEQIDGLSPDLGIADKPIMPSAWPSIYEWVICAGASVRVGGARAAYSPALDAILMPHISAFESEEHFSATLAHESVHFTGHKSRLDRFSDYATDIRARAREELIAELGAAIIGAMTGLAPFHLEDHAAYLDHWLGIVRDEPRAFLSAGAKAQAAVDWLIEKAGPPPGASRSIASDDDPSIAPSAFAA